MNRLPQKKKPGDPVLASDWNTLLDAITARTPMPGAGLELIASSGGFAYSSPTGPLAERQSLPPFAVIGIERSGTNYDVVIREGWVIERKPKSGDLPTVKFHMPQFGDDRLNVIPRPKIGMSIGDTLWCKYVTDVMGEVTEDPEIIVSSDDQDGSHYQPEDPEESGQDGTYYVKILKLENDDGSPQVKVYQQSDIEHWAQLWTGRNLGSGSRVYKRHVDAENVFEFRSIKAGTGVTVTEQPDEVEIEADAGSHPWKVTDGGDGNAAIAAGHVLGYYFEYADAAPNAHPFIAGTYGPDSIVLGPGGSYPGGTAAITGTKYIYAEVPRNSATVTGSRPIGDDEYCESMDGSDIGDVGVELFDDLKPGLTDAATIVTSTEDPENYTPTTGKAAVCIAKVTNTAGTITVDDQYVTHNPTLFVPLVDVLAVHGLT